MPFFTALTFNLDFTTNIRILDTNVLYARFYPKDLHHADAYVYLEETDVHFLVPIAVIVEVFGLIVGSLKRREYWDDLVSWIENPGNNVTILPQECHDFPKTREVLKCSRRLDCVDVLILSIGNDFTVRCKMKSPVVVASFDYSELFVCRQKFGYKVLIEDPVSREIFK